MPHIAAADLPLPAIKTLSQAQQRGVQCVFCAVTLSARTAVDLGPRMTDAHGSAARWFPRCCTTCRKGRAS
ncbi:hypothetical protein [Streptomyces sp. NPDC000133]|uniref:hypothetical protein n=1 Tax=Streptomyces sp. NPDC000133 TaxID=3364535 RepID=UPI003678E57E